ncbi:PAS domain S-box protein [Rhabdothermincola sediminis]|uniref:PAS domain S-box protein n=1 Tax=Rhabdothermincola sediminis TaxID=2751370 RepID=UPI001AA04A7C|nr:PAS domain S-box protein [Rhabdothermincola sediminis]
MTTIEERLSMLSRLPGDVVSLLGPDGRVRYVSPSVERTLGYTVEQYLALDPTTILHPEDRQTSRTHWERVITGTGEPLRWELRMRHADGSWRWIEIVASNHLDDPSIGAIFANYRDVTERRHAEDALRASEDRLRAVLQNSRDLIAVISEHGQIVWVSPGVTEMLGWSTDELTGTNAFDLVHPEDRSPAFDRLAEAVTSDRPADPIVVRIRRSTGEWLPAEVVGSAWRTDDRLEGVVINVRDVRWRLTAEQVRKQSEERFEALVRNSHDGILLLDGQAVITYATPSIEKLFGRPFEEVQRSRRFEWVHPDDVERVATALAEVMSEPQSRASLQARVLHADGTYRWAEAVAVNLLDHDAVRAVVINIRDVTDQKRAEEALRASEERFRSLVRFSGSVVQILDDDARVRWCSPSAVEVIGYTDDELLGAWVGDYAHPDDLKAATEAFLTALRKPGSTSSIVCRVRHRDGSWRWLECTFTNRRKDRTIAGMVANYRDVTDQRQAEQALRESERLFRSLARSSPTGIFQQNALGECIYVNHRWQEITGFAIEHALGHGWRRIIHPDDRARLDAGQAGARRAAAKEEFRVVRPDGDIRWVAVQTAPLYDDDGTFAGTVGAIEDITERIAAQQDSQRLIDIFEATNDLVAMADASGRLLYLNRASRQFFGLSEHAELEGFDVFEHLPGELIERLALDAAPALDAHDVWSGEIPLVRHDGSEVPHLAQLLVHRDHRGRAEYYSAVLRDISELKAFEHRLAHQATHDPLTGLPNRTLLIDRLTMALARSRRHQRPLAVLFLDLDHFKVVNDSLGHGLGDRLLVAISERLQAAVRPGDTIARFGGDEFVVLCEDLVDRKDAIAIAERLIAALDSPFPADENEVFVGASIGLAFPEDPTAEPEALIRDADAAMYRAKERGRGRWVVFDSTMRAHAIDRLDIESALRRALERRELRVFYQPVVCLASGDISGVEALLRWEHPERGMLNPGDFIRVAEETGLIVPIGAWVLEQACRQVQRWRAQTPSLDQLVVSVNLSGRQLGHPDVVDEVATVLTSTGVDPALVEIEITESVLMDDVEMSHETLGRLKHLGVKLAVDDFGTGYSSLSYLRRFPVDLLKVDRSFVHGLGRDPGDSAIVTAIITLAHTLGLEAVAEGVETAQQLAELRQLGCDKAQGFHIARPAPEGVIEQLLTSGGRW